MLCESVHTKLSWDDKYEIVCYTINMALQHKSSTQYGGFMSFVNAFIRRFLWDNSALLPEPTFAMGNLCKLLVAASLVTMYCSVSVGTRCVVLILLRRPALGMAT